MENKRDYPPYLDRPKTIVPKKLNLCEMLKGHEGETFYSPLYGNVTLETVLPINSNYLYKVEFRDNKDTKRCFTSEGKYVAYYNNSECTIFPSKDQRDWEKWDKENNKKTPKTWSEYVKVKDIFTECAEICSNNGKDESKTFTNSPIEKAALALLKIHQLIEVGYGGNVSYEQCSELQYDNVYKIAPIGTKDRVYFHIVEVEGESSMNHIMFHTKKQAEEFLSYPENIQLLKDYVMI